MKVRMDIVDDKNKNDEENNGNMTDDTNELLKTNAKWNTIPAPISPDKTNFANSNNNHHTIGIATKGPLAKTTVNWVPIRIRWTDTKIDLRSSMVWRAENKENAVDNVPIEGHFIIEKLRKFYQSAKQYDGTCSMMAGATKDFMDPNYFNQEWTINRVKNR